jgi:hypothetical protein
VSKHQVKAVCAAVTTHYNTTHNKLLVMVKNAVVQYLKEKEQHVSGYENIFYFSLKAICFAGFFPYEKICNTPRNLKLYRAYHIIVYIIYCPILFSQIVKLYLITADLQQTTETVTHIVIGVGPHFVPIVINWY